MSDRDNGLRVLGSRLESAGQALVARVGPLNVWTAALLARRAARSTGRSRAAARASLRIALYVPVALRVLSRSTGASHRGRAARS